MPGRRTHAIDVPISGAGFSIDGCTRQHRERAARVSAENGTGGPPVAVAPTAGSRAGRPCHNSSGSFCRVGVLAHHLFVIRKSWWASTPTLQEFALGTLAPVLRGEGRVRGQRA